MSAFATLISVNFRADLEMLLEIRDVEKSFDDLEVLRGVSFIDITFFCRLTNSIRIRRVRMNYRSYFAEWQAD